MFLRVRLGLAFLALLGALAAPRSGINARIERCMRTSRRNFTMQNMNYRRAPGSNRLQSGV